MMTSLEDSGIGDTNTANDLKKMNLLEMSGDHTILEHVLMAKASASNSNTPDSLENNTNVEEVIDISMIQLKLETFTHVSGRWFQDHCLGSTPLAYQVKKIIIFRVTIYKKAEAKKEERQFSLP